MNSAPGDPLADRHLSAATQPSPADHLRWGFWLLLAITVAVRLPGIDRPLVGVFATKNAVYAMIARNWAEGRAGIGRPTLDCLAGGERSWHLVEFPVSAYLSGGLWRVCGGSLDVWGRLTSIGFSTASVALLFFLVRRWHGAAAAWGASLTLALAPVSVVYGQSFMLEASVVTFTLGTIYTMERWLDTQRWPWLAIASVAFALLLLTKIYMLVLVLPLALWGRQRRAESRGSRARGKLSRARLWTLDPRLLAFTVAIIPAAWWYTDAFLAAAPDSPMADRLFYSVQQSVAVHTIPHPLLFQAGFYHQALADVATYCLSPVGFVLALLGLTDRGWRRHAAWLASMGVLMLALPRKFHEMNYYYLVVLPPLAILAGLGWRRIGERLRPRRLAIAALIAVAVAASLRYSLRPAFVTPAEDQAVVAAAGAVRELTRADEPVVTLHGSTIDLLYYCDRPGWAVSSEMTDLASRLDDCRRHGARYIVIAGPNPSDSQGANSALLAALPAIVEGDGFRVCRLPDVSHGTAAVAGR